MSLLWVLAIVVLGGWSVAMVGVTGGPNHGEHPLLCSVVHAVAFAWKGPVLSTAAVYWAGLAAAGAISIVAMYLTNAAEPPRGWKLAARVGIAVAYVTMLWSVASSA